MPRGMFKSGRFRKVFVKTPGGDTKIHYREHKPKKLACAKCGTPLAGTPRATHSELRNMPKTSRRPERPYGGVLCAKCTRETIKQKMRAEE
jgi:large subunit ribosomal protein L34e